MSKMQHEIDLQALEKMNTMLALGSDTVDAVRIKDPFTSVAESFLRYVEHGHQLPKEG